MLNDEADFYSAACMGVNASGASVNKVIPDTSAASTQVYLDSDVMVYISCSFGDPFLSGRAVTQLTLERRGNLATNWVGYVTSTLNQ
ncbi:MAG TPA: hypothetical protein VEV82_00600 [Actinomycetota bacterium]|nr:hypothetical protein [Actinomycetota bacterium]